MAKEVRWTPEAVSSFNRILEYLAENRSIHEAENFAISTDRVIDFISEYPKMFRKTNRKNIREALITPHNLLIYKIYDSRIDLLVFWDTRQHPAKKKIK